nr:putative ribonuclease H-like domain-containing protein [Tanacetum cinerariifolium]
MNSIVCHSNAHVLNTKFVTAVKDGSNLVCVSCGKDVFMLSREKCVARYALFVDSRVKRALFTSSIAAKSKNLRATSVVAKSRFNVATTSTATDKVSSASSLFPDSKQSRTLSTYMKNKLAISRKWKKLFENQLHFNWSPKRDTVQSTDNVTKRSSSNLKGDDLLTESCDSNLYTIFIFELVASSPVCLMSKATSTKSWLRHRRTSHLNFGTKNHLTKKDLVDGLPKFKYDKYHLCSACEQGKSKKASFLSKLVPSTESKLELLHMDLCGPMRVMSINEKKYILVIIDDYSRYTMVFFLHSKDETPDMIINFINQVQRSFKARHMKIQTYNGTDIKNEKLRSFYVKLGIVHQTLIARTPQQNDVVKRQPGFNYTNFQDSSKDSQTVLSITDLDNLFGPLYEEYYATSTPEVSDNFVARTFETEDTCSLSSIVVEEYEAPQIVTTS